MHVQLEPQRLAEEAEDRSALEERLKARLDDAGDDAGAEAVAAWEGKHARLKARYRVRAFGGLASMGLLFREGLKGGRLARGCFRERGCCCRAGPP